MTRGVSSQPMGEAGGLTETKRREQIQHEAVVLICRNLRTSSRYSRGNAS